MFLNIIGLVAGASFSGAFMFPKPACYIAAFVAAGLVAFIRSR